MKSLWSSNCPSARGRMKPALNGAKHEWVVWTHEDVYLPDGWDQCMANQLREAERQFGQIGVAGVYGVGEVVALADRS